MWFEGIAWAQSETVSKAAGGANEVLLTVVVPIAALFAIYYFLLIRPQTKKASEHEKTLKALKRNDEVVTTGGLIGRIVEIGDKVLMLEIAQGVRVRIERHQIAGLSPYGKVPVKKEKSEQ